MIDDNALPTARVHALVVDRSVRRVLEYSTAASALITWLVVCQRPLVARLTMSGYVPAFLVGTAGFVFATALAVAVALKRMPADGAWSLTPLAVHAVTVALLLSTR